VFLQQQRSKIVHEKGEENSEIPDKNRAPAIYESKNALKSNFEEKISAELKSVIQEKAEEAIREFIKKSVKKYKELPPEKIISALSKEEKEEFPSSIFSEKISSLEAITKYFAEEKKYSYKKISQILNRDERTIWTTYKRASRKMPERVDTSSTILIPAAIIASRKLSVLESIVHFLHAEKKLPLSRISLMLHRNQRTIWTVESRTKKKLLGNE